MEANLRRKISNNKHTGFFVSAVLAGVIFLTAGCGAKYEEVTKNLGFLKYEYFTCSVVRVDSADSFFCEPPNLNIERIRLAGVEVIPGRESEAKKFSESILGRGTLVKVETGESVDTDGGPLSYVFVPGGKMLNVLLVENGYAEPVMEELNEKYRNIFPATGNR